MTVPTTCFSSFELLIAISVWACKLKDKPPIKNINAEKYTFRKAFPRHIKYIAKSSFKYKETNKNRLRDEQAGSLATRHYLVM
jgi:hypothetical protein